MGSPKVWSFSIMKPVLFLSLIHQKSRLWLYIFKYGSSCNFLLLQAYRQLLADFKQGRHDPVTILASTGMDNLIAGTGSALTVCKKAGNFARPFNYFKRHGSEVLKKKNLVITSAFKSWFRAYLQTKLGNSFLILYLQPTEAYRDLLHLFIQYIWLCDLPPDRPHCGEGPGRDSNPGRAI